VGEQMKHKQRAIEYLIRVNFEPPNKDVLFTPRVTKLGDFFRYAQERRIITDMNVVFNHLNDTLTTANTRMLVYNHNATYRWIVHQSVITRFNEEGLIKMIYVQEVSSVPEFIGGITVFGDRWKNYCREGVIVALFLMLVFLVAFAHHVPPTSSYEGEGGVDKQQNEVKEWEIGTLDLVKM
jgi:hypothetical protein